MLNTSPSSQRSAMEAASTGDALNLLREHGVTLVRNALDLDTIAPLRAAAERYAEMIDAIRHADGNFSALSKRHNFNPKSYAADFIAVDPLTAASDDVDFRNTLLYKAVVAGPLEALLKSLLTQNGAWSMARIRVVFSDSVNASTRGQLHFHQEKLVSNFPPGLHNIWVPLMPDGAMAGRDGPGLEFYLGDRHALSKEDVVALRTNRDVAQKYYRPQLAVGDVLIFDGQIPHASFFPEEVSIPRIAVDVRLFPNPGDRPPFWRRD
jgi:ectoine hydroxylase-related dioxygenase (phytanoyl-CoA dioxygenase family)